MGALDHQEAHRAQQRNGAGGALGQDNPLHLLQLGSDGQNWSSAAEELGNGMHKAEHGPGVTLAANRAHPTPGFVRRNTACHRNIGLCCLTSRLNTQPHCANWQ